MKTKWKKTYKDGKEITPLDLRHSFETKKFVINIDDFVVVFTWRIYKKQDNKYILIDNGKSESLSYAKKLTLKKIKSIK